MKTREEKLETRRKWYQKNKITETKRLRASNKKREKEYKKWWKELKDSLKCARCPEDHIAVLDFHHKDPSHKEFNISNAIRSCYNKQRILDEIDKCEVLCSNCHRKLHWK